MKQILLILAVVALVGCGKKESPETQRTSKGTPTSTSWVSDSSDLNNVKIEAAIRNRLRKPEGELTKADLEKVRELVITGQELTSTESLGKLTKLEKLNLFNNNLANVKGLEKLSQLQVLNLGINQLIDVKGLEKLNQLTALNLGNNPNLPKAEIDALKKAFPNCRINHSVTK